MLFKFFSADARAKNFSFLMQVSQGTEISRAILTTRNASATKINQSFAAIIFQVIKSENGLFNCFSSIE